MNYSFLVKFFSLLMLLLSQSFVQGSIRFKKSIKRYTSSGVRSIVALNISKIAYFEENHILSICDLNNEKCLSVDLQNNLELVDDLKYVDGNILANFKDLKVLIKEKKNESLEIEIKKNNLFCPYIPEIEIDFYLPDNMIGLTPSNEIKSILDISDQTFCTLYADGRLALINHEGDELEEFKFEEGKITKILLLNPEMIIASTEDGKVLILDSTSLKVYQKISTNLAISTIAKLDEKEFAVGSLESNSIDSYTLIPCYTKYLILAIITLMIFGFIELFKQK